MKIFEFKLLVFVQKIKNLSWLLTFLGFGLAFLLSLLDIKKTVVVYGFRIIDIDTNFLCLWLLYQVQYPFVLALLLSLCFFGLVRIFDFDLRLSMKIFSNIKRFLKVTDDERKKVYDEILRSSSVWVGRKSKVIIISVFVPFEQENRIYSNEVLNALSNELVEKCRKYKGFERCSSGAWQDKIYHNKKYEILKIKAST